MASLRRSTRTRKPNTKYSLDPLEGLDLRASSDSGSATSPVEAIAESSSDEEFDAAIVDEIEDGDELDTSENGGEDASADDIQSEKESGDDDDSIVGSERNAPTRRCGPGKPHRGRWFTSWRSRQRPPGEAQVTHTRGIRDIYHNSAMDLRIAFSFGSAKEDMEAGANTVHRWSQAPMLPTRKERAPGFGGLRRSYFTSEQDNEREASAGWEWYDSRGGKESVAKRQKIAGIGQEQATKYMPSPGAQNFLIGPLQSQQIFSLGTGHAFPISRAYHPEDYEIDQSTPSGRPGWIINIGQRIRCMEWLPSQNGAIQYLAVSTLERPLHTDDDFKRPPAHAFKPNPPRPDSIQIWSIFSTDLDDREGVMDPNRTPRLVQVLCADWGAIRSFKFCPMLRHDAAESQETGVHFGLLALISSDGKLRVFDVSLTDPTSPSTVHAHLEQPAFESSPPETVYTSVTWLSPSFIAAGCANGCVAIWDLSSVFLATDRPQSHPPTPWWYRPQHATYILSLTSCWPSRPHFLASCSMSGYVRLTDMRDPAADTVLSPRLRVAQAPLVWYEPAHAMLTPDDNYMLRALTVRRFHSSVYVARATAPILSVAASPFHASVLYGAADGRVCVFNPTMKALGKKCEVWTQAWFMAEWRRPQAQGTALGTAAMSSSSVHDGISATGDQPSNGLPRASESRSSHVENAVPDRASVMKNPLTRFTAGYKAEKLNMTRTPTAAYHLDSGGQSTTLYEEPSGVTSVCWNPNLRTATWAAAGMGSGLIRIEDLATD